MLEKLNLGKQGADLCSSPVTQLFVAAYFKDGDWREYLERLKELYRRRRDTMLEALEEHFGGKATWTKPQGGLFIWATLDGGVDTTDLLAHSEGVAFVPGRAAYMDGRSGASSMRLNFAGVPDEDIREGMRRIGRVDGRAGRPVRRPDGVARPVSRRDGARRPPRMSRRQPARRAGGLADVVELPRRDRAATSARRSAGEQQDR